MSNIFSPDQSYRRGVSRHADILVWRYGVQRALNIIAGLDDKANADQRVWREMGRK